MEVRANHIVFVRDMHVAKHSERRDVAIKKVQRCDRNLDVNDRLRREAYVAAVHVECLVGATYQNHQFVGIGAADFLTSQIQMLAAPTLEGIFGQLWWRADGADTRFPRGVREGALFPGYTMQNLLYYLLVTPNFPQADF
jgi:hypothetical protein